MPFSLILSDKPSLKGGRKPISRRKSPPRIGKVGKVEDIQHIPHFKLSRPPSNFVKTSPVPFVTAPRGKETLLTSGVSPAAADMIMPHSHKLESMRLPQLKELAKSRGVKGYSNLKKKELIELLRSWNYWWCIKKTANWIRLISASQVPLLFFSLFSVRAKDKQNVWMFIDESFSSSLHSLFSLLPQKLQNSAARWVVLWLCLLPCFELKIYIVDHMETRNRVLDMFMTCDKW